MSVLEAIVLHEFTSRTPEELNINAHEKIFILNQEHGNGWSFAQNLNGEKGIIPLNYYEIINPSPPVSPCIVSIGKSEISDSFDSNSTGSGEENPVQVTERQHVDRRNTTSTISSETGNTGGIRMPKKFLKNGGEEFLFGQKIFATQSEAQMEIIKDGVSESCHWKQLGKNQNSQIESHKTESKFRGMKTFITYQFKSTYSEKSINRRYNQFIWLHEQLTEKYPCIIIPPLPGKQAVGRFKSDFIEERKIRLQKWLNHITDHPVLSYGYTVELFLSASDKHKWKEGKRKSERDTLKNGGFYNAVDAPIDSLDCKNYSKGIEKISTFIKNFDENSCNLQESYDRFHRKHNSNIFKEYEKIGTAIVNLSNSMSLNPNNFKNDINLMHGIMHIGNVYKKIGNLFKNQAKIDRDLVEVNLEEIIGITREIPSLIELAKCGVLLEDTYSRRNAELKVDSETVEAIDKSVQVILRSVDAELNWLQNRREHQLRSTMIQYLTNQIQLFTQITDILKESLSHL